MRRGFIFQVVYPKEGLDLPKSLEEWDIRTPCSACHNLSADYRKCAKCGKTIFSFSLVSAYYHSKGVRVELQNKIKQTSRVVEA